ncbi:Amidohydrolase 2 [Verrucomicrobia bacterium]|nr:Amidohydrolase 2 [Verrucomicrobiota bacterium]
MKTSAKAKLACCLVFGLVCRSTLVAWAQASPDQLLLKDYQPRSIFRIPQTQVDKARYRVIDMHSHDYAPRGGGIENWIKNMDAAGIQKTIILSGATGKKFDEILARYGKFPDRFEVWCGLDYSEFDQSGYGPAALAELERCHQAGATGVGELSDKGRGLNGRTNLAGMHPDDPRLDAIYEKCADLHMPLNIHVGEDKWMYEPMDASNDGLMNGWTWRVSHDPAVLQHDEVIETIAHAAKKHPRTTFIACHLANCCSDLNRLAAMFDSCPNLYADLGARYGEIAPIPRFASQFIERYQDRIVYGTDAGTGLEMYRTSFRLLETSDEHFYPNYQYHWAWYGFALPDEVLKKIYRANAEKILRNGQGSQ